MYQLWDDVVAPVIDALGARRVIEIGALRGETTARMLERLGGKCELHVIDPEPQFDPAEHERAFPGRYHFHRGTSHEVLPGLPPADAVLVDGDHNWYTVYHELRMLAETAQREGVPLPVLVLHDVGWPYGRRDLYYEPDRIPEEFRQPWARAGMRPGEPSLVYFGGLNRHMANASREGGASNGVMTAVDDFVAEHPRPLRVVVLPIFYGLAIVAEDRVMDAHPDLGAFLDHLEGPAGTRALLDLGERIRIDEAILTQAWLRNLEEQRQRSADRYLELVKALLLDERNLQHEIRISYMLGLRGAPPDPSAVRDPVRALRHRYNQLVRARHAGRPAADGLEGLALTTMGRAQLERLGEAAGGVLAIGVPGDFVEVGVGGGGGGILLQATLHAYEVPGRCVWLADTFSATAAFDAAEGTGVGDLPQGVRRLASDLNAVRDNLSYFGLLDDGVRFLQGRPVERLSDAPMDRLALVRIGEGPEIDPGHVLEILHPRLSPGAQVIVSGVSDPDVEAAVGRARDRLGVTAPLQRIDWNAVTWTHDGPAQAAAPPGAGAKANELASAARSQATSPPPAAPASTDSVALSVVVVFYNMRREAARTLHSLSRSYQRDIQDLDYEVLVVDNGSDPDQRLGADHVASFGPEFRLLEPEGEAHPSPTGALNAGIAASKGDGLALMIDGAHVLSPGVLHLGMKALRIYEPAVVATQQWYVGPGQQGDAQQAGYDQRVEDRLFASIDWPADGYRLFEIGHFIGERDWFDGIIESNCLFAPRKQLEQVGGFDESFSMPGGGYANLDLFERLAQAPGVTTASILGEGTFHQFHGGTTTNVADEAARRERLVSYRRHFEELRGRSLVGGDRPLHYVGALTHWATKRTRSRRWPTLAFDALREPTDLDGPPVPVPDEVKLAAIESVWDHQAWRETTWLGHPVNRYPADLHVYQELLARLRPDLVVLVGEDRGLGGRALYVASVCDQLGHGRVVGVGAGDASAALPSHPRLSYVAGEPESSPAAGDVAALAGEPPNAMVILGLGATPRVAAAFGRYAPLVPVGGYVVVENTVVNGRPVRPGFAPGPYEAVEAVLAMGDQFVPDAAGERYTVTFNRNGYLKRVRT